MKEIYAWVDWFSELCQKIANEDSGDLVKKAKLVPWSTKPSTNESDNKVSLLRFGDKNIDPFSFIYFLASRNNWPSVRKQVFPAITRIFNLSVSDIPLDIEDFWLFPTPQPQGNVLFHGGDTSNPNILWNLFRQVVRDPENISENDFEAALKIKLVGVSKLTQALYLMSPRHFFPLDKPPTGGYQLIDKKLYHYNKTFSLNEYTEELARLRSMFLGCEFYEVNFWRRFLSPELSETGNCTVYQFFINEETNDQLWNKFDVNNYLHLATEDREFTDAISQVKKGDIVLVRSKSRALGISVVHRNDYTNQQWAHDHRLHVGWINKESTNLISELPTTPFSQSPVVENYFRQLPNYESTWRIIDEWKRSKSKPQPQKKRNKKTREHINQILFGPPGTGKTWEAERLALRIVEGENEIQENESERLQKQVRSRRIQFITFHQNYDYGDFIEGLRPVLDESKKIAYELHEGVFKRLCVEAEQFPEVNFVLIIDEINRGNIAKIFGELITLIEESRRGKTSATLPHSNEQLTVPNNLYLIGTMNTADRSIQLLDTALRRRFEFVELMPDANHDLVNSNCDGINLRSLLFVMNERIASLLDRERQIGHTYFFDLKTVTDLKRCFQKKVLPLLQEYFYDDWEKIDMVLGRNGFIKLVKMDQIVKQAMHGLEDGKRYEKLEENESDWDDVNCYKKIYENRTSGDLP